MDTISYKTISANKATVKKEWIIVDAKDEILGRFASRVAMILRGKHKSSFTPHVDCGDNVIVINAEKVQLTGNKWDEKEYVHHTGYPGGQRIIIAKDLLKKNPIGIVENSVRGMLPKNRLGRDLFRNLFVYEGSEHPHAAQQPKEINLNTIK
ncbi:MAG: 50S ribosomal protein L13 [Bacteroidetes bacterium GWF2_33_38]|nr:MAG: 50S ribosomal protein L13 [Bacteroidetes bacterium GWF2_33_38]OFY74211.1 MAG: 50S ribosomal protein L13 [Bacteroidetes bacterium RIFOXYA12_FULL_33_9]OFY89863.1 MAG: 50S ribosomal protein L13 [Bacteroidetes bacterium RIFOXYA2_FULL_33_7]HBX50626.1 50S ribosomal protein L13 [Bacteroidales bacterium]